MFYLFNAPAQSRAPDVGTPPMSESPWSLLPAASENAQGLDQLYVFIWILCGISFVLVIGAMLYFMVKYKKPKAGHRKTSPITHNGKLEFWWSAIPAIFLFVIFSWGEIDYMKLVAPQSDAIDIRVTGQKWSWTVDYPDVAGATLRSGSEKNPTTLIVPVGVPVRLTMTSIDVIHSFYIPAFRVKKDVVPGRYTVLSFTATKPGMYPLFCAEYCGDQHSYMVGRVLVVETMEEYRQALAEAAKLEQETAETMAAFGARVFDRGGCNQCHSIDGSAKVGPTFKGVYGRQEVLSTGETITVEDNYIRQSIIEPNSQIVQGYGPQMPSFAGRFNEQQTTALIEYLKTLK